ncbi:MAG TPA: amidohydrolase [Acidimicrobiia bacterium]|jgi:amidohydrolase|nr:amidohydrolase [Acidimicrobiia bacterium]
MGHRTVEVIEHARAIAPAMVSLRRDLHLYPEVGWTEHRTTRKVAEHLHAFGLRPTVRAAGTGLTMDIGEGDRLVGFRADLDALPIEEDNAVPYRSQHAGVMHACGHDVHTAIGVGIAGVLSKLDPADIPGRIRILFQPAEEQIPGGAAVLCEEGAVDGMSAIVAFHVDPSLPVGSIGLRRGGITGASDRLTIRLNGPGGHTSRPHQTVDIGYAAGRVITDLPGLLRHGVDPRETIALVFGRISGGSADNVIPTHVELGGTVRLFNLDLWRTMHKVVEQHVHDLVAPLGATAEINYVQGSPPVVNHDSVIAAFERAGNAVLGELHVTGTHQSLGSEDFAWYLENVPGALIRLGSALPDRRTDLHSATFDVDEACIEYGIRVGTAALLDLLEQ